MKKMILGIFLSFFSFLSSGMLNKNGVVADFLNQETEIGEAYQAGLAQMKRVMEHPETASDAVLQRFLGITQEEGHFKRPEWFKGQKPEDSEESFFESLQRLRTQNICFLANIPFEKADSLFELYLAKKNITHLAPNLFQNFTSLQWLCLLENQLTRLPWCVFEGLGKLQKLYLEKNQIAQLHPGIFEGLDELQELYLGENHIAQFYPGVFWKLNKLKKLSLRGNKLTQLLGGAFVGLSNLQELHLNHNRITQLLGGAFVGLEELQELYLGDNQLTDLTEDVFKGLPKLRWLSLKKNQIGRLLKGFFEKLPAINLLELQDNFLYTVPVFSMPKNTFILCLTNNKLTRFTGDRNLWGVLELQRALGKRFIWKEENLPKVPREPIEQSVGEAPLEKVREQAPSPALLRKAHPLSVSYQFPSPRPLQQLSAFSPYNPQRERLSREAEGRPGFSSIMAPSDLKPLVSPAAKLVRVSALSPTEKEAKRMAQAFGPGLKKARFIFPFVTLENPHVILKWFETVWENWHKNPETIAACTNDEYTSAEPLKSRLLLYLKGLFDLPLGPDEKLTWQPKGQNKEAIQKGIASVFHHLNANPGQVLGAFDQLYIGLLQCPMGQWEAAVTVMRSLKLDSQEAVSGSKEEHDVWNQVSAWLSRLKEELFQKTILSRCTANHLQNVWIISRYADLLREDLGLAENAFQDPFHFSSADPFRGDKWLVALLYYQMLEKNLIPELQGAMDNPDSPLPKGTIIQLWAKYYSDEKWWNGDPEKDVRASLNEWGAKRFLEEMFILRSA